MGQLEDMQAFIRIVDAGGIGRAAAQMDIAKSAISRRLRDLETRLGVKLLQRTTRVITLTEAGRRYYQSAVKVADDVAELNSVTANADAELRGTIRLAAPVSFGVSHLSSVISDFVALHPQLEFDIQFSDRHVDLIQEGIDLAIRIGDLKDSSLIARRITPVRLVMCASPAYLAKFGEPQTPDELRSHKVMRYAGSSSGNWHLIDPEGRNVAAKPKANIIANNGDFLRDLAIKGQGIIISPTFICWQQLRDLSLQRVLPNFRVASLDAYAIYPETRYLSPRTRSFINYLVERFGDSPYWDTKLDNG